MSEATDGMTRYTPRIAGFDWQARAENAEADAERLAAAVGRMRVLPGEMRDRAGAYHPKEQRRGAGAHQELQEWARAIEAAIEGGEEWEEIYRPRHTAREALRQHKERVDG